MFLPLLSVSKLRCKVFNQELLYVIPKVLLFSCYFLSLSCSFSSLPLVQGALPQICCWGAEMGENGDIINAGLIEFHASRSSSIVNGKTPQSTTHESEANQTVSNIRIIDDTNTEVHVPKVQPYYCWETSLGDFEYSPDTFPSKLKLLYIFIRVSCMCSYMNWQHFQKNGRGNWHNQCR